MSLTNKLSLLVTFGILLVLLVLGIYFDTFIKQSFLDSTRERMFHGYQRLAYNLQNLETELHEGAAFVLADQRIVASVELINNYQDKQNYNTYLIDEEKKGLAVELLNRVKLSFNSDGVLYDGHDELIAFVSLESQGYRLHYVSYEAGEPRLYSRLEFETEYRQEAWPADSQITFRHTPQYRPEQVLHDSLITYQRVGQGLAIRVHQSIPEEGSERIVAHVELSNLLDELYFQRLSRDLDMTIRLSFDARHAGGVEVLSKQMDESSLHIDQTDREYIGAMEIPTLDGPVYAVATLNKGQLLSALNDNRRHSLILLGVVATLVLLLMRLVISRALAQPLDALMGQIGKIERQDYSVSSVVATGDELESISENVNRLAEAVREREESLRLSQEELEYLSSHDPLTDLPNRRFFNQRLEHALEIARRHRSQLALFFLDLDQFKQVNDTLGHDIGDDLLRAVSERLNAGLRRVDTIARIGGDEFNILLENVDGLVEIEQLVDKLLAMFHTPFICAGQTIAITASIGVALYPQDGRDSVTLSKHADLAMYKAKEGGRNNYSLFSAELFLDLQRRIAKTQALKAAIAAGDQFVILYQPKIAVTTGRIHAVEALLRWHSPEFGVVRPDQFIGLAEETGLIIPIGEWVMEHACRDFVRLREEGCTLEHVSVNLSNAQLQHGDMVATLERVISRSGIVPSQLELEITESYIATDVVSAIQTLRRFRAMEVQLAVDDFGTGYSSMSYLQQLPVTRLKIDKSFIEELPRNSENVAITRAIIALAKAFGLATTAEGVETAEQLAFLESERCDEIQGYYYAKPMPIEELKQYCAMGSGYFGHA